MIAVIVTRPLGEADPLVGELRRQGYRVHAVPTVVTEAATVAATDLDGYDWIVVTSATGVAALPAIPAGVRWAAVGPATADALRRRGVEPEIVPEIAIGTAIAAELPDPAGQRVLLARADAATPDLPDALRRRGAEVVELAVYRTVEAPPASRALLSAALADPDLRAVVFTSGSAVRGFVGLGGGSDLAALTIGPRTTEAASRAGFEILAEAADASVAALTRSVAKVLPLEEVKSDA
jgi:uroporphyrinogen III methyltransferase/synthase